MACHSISNSILFNRLLSPIIENSTEMVSTPVQLNKTCSNTSKNSLNIALTNENLTINELIHIFLQRFYQYTKNFHTIQNYLNHLNRYFKELSIIIEDFRNNRIFNNTIEYIETRLLQMRVKRDQINHLLNQSSMKTHLEKILPLILKSKLTIDSNEFLTSIQLNMNQKIILVDHLENEYQYRKYRLSEYSLKLKRQHELLMKLINRIQCYMIQYNEIIKQENHLFITNKYHRQLLELTNLSNEYEQLQNEYHLLIIKARENIQSYSTIMLSNYH